MRWIEFLQIVHRTFYIQALWTYEKMLSTGYAVCLIPFARRWFQSTEEVNKFLGKNLIYFNTHPYMAGWIVGAAIKLEEENTGTRAISVEQQHRFKRRMSESLAAIGDQLFWNRIKPLTALLGLIIALYYGVAGVIFFLVAYNLPHFYQRFVGVWVGYRQGFNIMQRISHKRYGRYTNGLLSVSALLVGGALVLAASSDLMPSMEHRVAFVMSAGISAFLLKFRMSIPGILFLVLICGSVAGFIMK